MSLGSAFLVYVKAPFHLRRDEKSNYFFTFYFPLDYPASLLSMFRFTLTICYRVDRVDYRQRERQPPPSGTSSLTPFFSPSLPPLSHYVFIRPSICPPFALLRSAPTSTPSIDARGVSPAYGVSSASPSPIVGVRSMAAFSMSVMRMCVWVDGFICVREGFCQFPFLRPATLLALLPLFPPQ